MAYFACRNGGSGGSEETAGKLTVLAGTGRTVTCTKGATTLSQTVGGSGSVVFYLPIAGEWSVSDGYTTKSITVAEYGMSFSTLNLLYDTGLSYVEWEVPTIDLGTSGTPRLPEFQEDKMVFSALGAGNIGSVLCTKESIDLTSVSSIDIVPELGEEYKKTINCSNVSGSKYFFIVTLITDSTPVMGKIYMGISSSKTISNAELSASTTIVKDGTSGFAAITSEQKKIRLNY